MELHTYKGLHLRSWRVEGREIMLFIGKPKGDQK